MRASFSYRCVRPKAARAAALCLVALAAVLCQSREARAQWTTSGATTSTTNNVGVGTSTPASTLEVSGPDGTLTLSQPGVAGRSHIQSALGVDLHMSANARWANYGWGRNDATLPSWNFFLAPSAGADYAGIRRAAPSTGAFAWVDIMRITANGNVGIGNNAPQSLLDISGASGMTLRNSAGSAGFSFFDRSTVPGDQVVFQGNGGNYSLFNVSTKGANFGTERGSGMAFWTVDIANTPNATQFQFQYTPNYGPVFFTQKFGTGAQGDKKISFQTAWQNTAVAPSQLVLDTSGNVGVGTSAPASKLHVAGNVTVDGNINAKYQDVAEWVPTTQKLQAGTVVVLDAGRDNHVAASKASYDTRVAGVVSAQPGITLGEAGEGKALVATTGRVKVKVDASQGPITVGDLLVTSDREGYAMKSEPVLVGKRQLHAPGTIIGKALQSLEKGTGEILVLLSLQ